MRPDFDQKDVRNEFLRLMLFLTATRCLLLLCFMLSAMAMQPAKWPTPSKESWLFSKSSSPGKTLPAPTMRFSLDLPPPNPEQALFLKLNAFRDAARWSKTANRQAQETQTLAAEARREAMEVWMQTRQAPEALQRRAEALRVHAEKVAQTAARAWGISMYAPTPMLGKPGRNRLSEWAAREVFRELRIAHHQRQEVKILAFEIRLALNRQVF